jgi:hypothetical protein
MRVRICYSILKEATTGFEPVIAVLQTAALPLGYVAWRLAILTVTGDRAGVTR